MEGLKSFGATEIDTQMRPMGWESLPAAISPCETVAIFHRNHVGIHNPSIYYYGLDSVQKIG